MNQQLPPPKILRIITRLNIGGPAIQAINLANSLDNHLLLYGSVDMGEGSMDEYIPLTGNHREIPSLVRPLSLWHDCKAMWEILRIINSYKPDIIHTHTAKAGLLGRSAALLATFFGGHSITIIHTYHGHVFRGYFSRIKTAFFIKLERFLAHKSDAIITISPKLKDELSNDFNLCRAQDITVIPLGFNLTPFKQACTKHIYDEFSLTKDHTICLAVGRLVPIKNHTLLLQAFALLHKKDPTTHLILVGDGILRTELEEQAKELNLSNALSFAGWQSNMPAFYTAASLNFLTSINEGTPVAIIEAAASATASIATDVGGISDIIEDGISGALIPLDENAAVDLAEKAYALLQDTNKRTIMGLAAQKKVFDLYTFERLHDDLLRLYQHLRKS